MFLEGPALTGGMTHQLMIGAKLRMSRQVGRLGLREWSDLPLVEEDFIEWLDLGLLKDSGRGNVPDIRRSFCVCGGPGPPYPRSPRGREPPGWLAILGQGPGSPLGCLRPLASDGGRWCNPPGCWTVILGQAPLAWTLLLSGE